MIEFSKEEKNILAGKLQMYFREELDQELGQFAAEFLLEFIGEEFGAYFYNRGLYDAQAVLSERIEAVAESIFEIEKPTEFLR